jgi:hypothetical protein
MLKRLQYILLLLLMLCKIPSMYAYSGEDTKDDKKPLGGGVLVSKSLPLVNIHTSLATNRHLVSPESDAEAAMVSLAVEDERIKAAGVFSELDKTGRFLEDLLEKDMLQLPVGFKKKLGTTGSVEVAVSRAEFFSQYAELTLYVRIKLPASGASSKEKILFFGAEKVRFTAAGGVSSFKALLLGDVPIVDSPDSYTVIIKGASGLGQGGEVLDPNQSYAQVDCGQFTEAQLSAEVLIPRKTIVPLTEGTLEVMEGRVTCGFKAKIVGSLDNLVGSLTFKTPFSSPSATGFAFKVQNASFDISSSDNPTSIAFPTEYVGDKSFAWQGVYIQNFTVYLPKQFKKKGSTARSSLSASNVIIDKTGFTGIVEATTPILSINEGSASGWAMSLDRIRVSVVQNSLTEGGFAGKIRLPVSQKSTLLYTGLIQKSKPLPGQDASTVSGLDYSLKVENANDIDFDLFKAKGKIKQSSITLAVINDEFKPEADLTGELSVSTTLDGRYDQANGIIKLDEIVFEHLILRTGDKPICGKIELRGKAGIANFPLTVTKLGLRTSCEGGNQPTYADLFVAVQVDILGKPGSAGSSSEDRVGFSGKVDLTIRAEQNTDGDWKFKEIVKPIAVELNGTLKVFKIKGRIELYEEQKSGITKKGFRGSAELILTKLNNLTICADAEFGSTTGINGADGDNYYYVAGSIKNLPVKIPIGGPIAINGFVGGIFYHMKPTNGSGETGGFKTLCSTEQTYVYSPRTSFGFKAGVNLIGVDPLPEKSFDGYAGLEMVFSRSGGLASLGFYAQAQLLADIDDGLLTNASKDIVEKSNKKGDFDGEPNRAKLDTKTMEASLAPKSGETYSMFDAPMTAPLAIRLGILLDFENGSYHGEANAYVNIGYLKGIGDGPNPVDKNLAGRLAIHFDSNVWYIHAGTSEKPMGLTIKDLPQPLNQAIITSTTYLMIGGNIPSYLPPPSPEACNFFGITAANFSNRSSNPGAVPVDSINAGKGFAFGMKFDAKIRVDAGVWAEGTLGVGLDILYTTKGNCGKATAKGRVYAYVAGKVGVGPITLLGLGVGILLQGGAPAPTYFNGRAHIEVTVLFWDYKEDFDVSIGDENNCLNTGSL